MNLKMTKDQFHELIMLYLIDMSKEIKDVSPETTMYSENFDQFLRHIASKPLGELKTVYYREDSEQKLHYRKLVNALEKRDDVRMLI